MAHRHGMSNLSDKVEGDLGGLMFGAIVYMIVMYVFYQVFFRKEKKKIIINLVGEESKPRLKVIKGGKNDKR